MTDSNNCFSYEATSLASLVGYPYGNWIITVNDVPLEVNIETRNSYGTLYNFFKSYNIDVGILGGYLSFKNNSTESYAITFENISEEPEQLSLYPKINPTLTVLSSIDSKTVTKFAFYLKSDKTPFETTCSCDFNYTGEVDISGKWDLIIDNKVLLKDATPRQIAKYFQDSPDYEVEVEQEEVIELAEDFDYVVINYYWTNANGTDLDTRTSVLEPPRNIEVGWNRQNTDKDYLLWAGDNTGSGTEAVLISTNNLLRDFKDKNKISILLKAFWYNTVGNGNFILSFTSYKGGVMNTTHDYNYINSGGTLIDNFTINCYTKSQDHDGVPLGTLDIDLINRKSTFKVLTNTTPIIQPPSKLTGVFSL